MRNSSFSNLNPVPDPQKEALDLSGSGILGFEPDPDSYHDPGINSKGDASDPGPDPATYGSGSITRYFGSGSESGFKTRVYP
jgi:hypothetical protein